MGEGGHRRKGTQYLHFREKNHSSSKVKDGLKEHETAVVETNDASDVEGHVGTV